MQEASIVGLFRTIVIFMIVYYVFKFLFKYVAPVILLNYIRKKTGQTYETPKKDRVKEGTTIIDKTPHHPKKNQTNYTEVEEVDYEEVD